MTPALVLALSLVLGAASDSLPDLAPATSARPVKRCATPEPSETIANQCRSALHRYRDEPGTVARGGRIRVAVHVMRCGSEGEVPDERIAAEIDELNRAFHASGFRFELVSVDRSDHCDWFHLVPGTPEEVEAKRALAVDPAHTLNLYTCDPGFSLLGWSYFPQSYAENDPMHGVVVHGQSLPGGAFSPFDLGRTAVHEVGHYLGLFHTFQNGCAPPGDDVDDTPFEATAASGCMDGRDTCEEPGDDPIHDYMDYSDDACMTLFTPGQIERMSAITRVYRPNLMGAAEPVVARPAADPEWSRALENASRAERRGAKGVGVVEFRGPTANPVRGVATIEFTLSARTHVTLRILDDSGHRVATLANETLDAGLHSVRWDARGGAGIYQAELSAGGLKERRTVVVE